MCGNPVEKNAALCPSCGVERICLNCGYKLDESFNLQSLVMPDYVEEMGVGVFDGCDRLAKYGKNK